MWLMFLPFLFPLFIVWCSPPSLLFLALIGHVATDGVTPQGSNDFCIFHFNCCILKLMTCFYLKIFLVETYILHKASSIILLGRLSMTILQNVRNFLPLPMRYNAVIGNSNYSPPNFITCT